MKNRVPTTIIQVYGGIVQHILCPNKNMEFIVVNTDENEDSKWRVEKWEQEYNSDRVIELLGYDPNEIKRGR